jgi:hypothetical protein
VKKIRQANGVGTSSIKAQRQAMPKFAFAHQDRLKYRSLLQVHSALARKRKSGGHNTASPISAAPLIAFNERQSQLRCSNHLQRHLHSGNLGKDGSQNLVPAYYALQSAFEPDVIQVPIDLDQAICAK